MGRVIVAGSIFMDVVTRSNRHPRVGETVAGHSINFFPGGKGANQAIAAFKGGVDTTLVGRVGDDAFGSQLLSHFTDVGISTDAIVRDPSGSTGTAAINVADDGTNTIVAVPGVSASLSVTEACAPAVSQGDVLVSLFEAPLSTIAQFFSKGQANGATTILTASPAQRIPTAIIEVSDVLLVNETELAWYAGIDSIDPTDRAAVLDAAQGFRGSSEQSVVVTLGEHGAVAIGPDKTTVEVRGHSVDAIDTTGAGDCFAGYLAACTASGDSFSDAIHVANAAAALSVQVAGAGSSMPDFEDVEKLLRHN